MAKKSPEAVSAADVARALVEVADADTVYRDVYLRRARAVLAAELPADHYRALKTLRRQADEAVAQSRSAAAMQDWQRVQELAARAEELRRSAETKAALLAAGERVYEAPSVAIDPFSPGLASFVKAAQDLAGLRDRTVAALGRLAAADASQAAFYDQRRAFLAGLAVAARQPEARGGSEARAARPLPERERLALEAGHRGDVAEMRRYAEEILGRQATAAQAPPAAAQPETEQAAARAADPCPVDLGAPFPAETASRARALGFAETRTAPLPQAAPLLDYVAAHLWQPFMQEGGDEREGARRIEALVDEGTWPPGLSEHVKVLVGQYVRHAFVNSGGARYRPAFAAAESVLVEDFPEGEEAPNDSAVLAGLGLAHRRALARDEIEGALLEHGARLLEERFGLDPYEFRLVCIPPDLYSRFGRDHGWGAQQQWTHFDGYQVIKGGRLRALVGGDVRYGGLADLVSIAASDRRESVIVRLAVVRRARQVGRWS